MMQANLYVVSAPSGGGKTSLVRALIESMENICVAVSYTTRSPRPGEIKASSYHFLKACEFQQLIAKDTLLEYAEVFGHYYGTPLQWVQTKLKQGIDVILEIDWQGRKQIQKKISNMVSIFLLPPSWETLNTRLIQRAQDTMDVIENRMEQARLEVSHCYEYDYLIVNENFECALEHLRAIIVSNRLRKSMQIRSLQSLLNNLI